MMILTHPPLSPKGGCVLATESRARFKKRIVRRSLPALTTGRWTLFLKQVDYCVQYFCLHLRIFKKCVKYVFKYIKKRDDYWEEFIWLLLRAVICTSCFAFLRVQYYCSLCVGIRYSYFVLWAIFYVNSGTVAVATYDRTIRIVNGCAVEAMNSSCMMVIQFKISEDIID